MITALSVWPRDAAADRTITAFGLDFGLAERLTAGSELGLDSEVSTSLQMLRVRADRYRGYGLELSYVWNDSLDFFSVMPRVELGWGKPRFNRRTPGRSAHAWVPYVAVSAGYGSGTYWDTEYIELYGSEEDVEVVISGVPMYAALGVRRIGGLALRLEAFGGVLLVTAKEADLPEGDAPSVLSSVGVRFAFGGDMFTYVWR